MSRVFTIQNGSLIYKRKYETLKIEGWGENALRVRATENRAFLMKRMYILKRVKRQTAEGKPLPS